MVPSAVPSPGDRPGAPAPDRGARRTGRTERTGLTGRRTRRPVLGAAAAGALLLAGCGGGSGSTGTGAGGATSGGAASSASSAATTAAASSGATGSTAGATGASGATSAGAVSLIEPGTLTTCTHLPYPPFQSEKGGKIVGFDVDLIDLVAKDLGVQQKIVDTPFETIKTGVDLNAGKCDVAAAGMTITQERKASLDFSEPYFDATQALLAKKGSGITSVESAQGKKVGSQSSTTGEDYVKGKGVDPVSFETSEAELNALKSGQVDVIVQDLPVVNGWLKESGNSGLEVVANLDTGEQYGFAVKKNGNPGLLSAINKAIERARADGTYDKIYAKWIGGKPTG